MKTQTKVQNIRKNEVIRIKLKGAKSPDSPRLFVFARFVVITIN